MQSTIISDLQWHIKNALTKKAILLPFIAPCYVAWFVWTYIGYYLDDFIETVKQKTDNERAAYIQSKAEDKVKMHSKALYGFYALTATVLYWFLFGFSHNLKGLEFLNYPAYFLTALPIEAVHQLAILPIKYKTGLTIN